MTHEPQPASRVLGADEWMFLAGVALVPVSGALTLGLGRVGLSELCFLAVILVLALRRPRTLVRLVWRNPVGTPAATICALMVVSAVVGGNDPRHAALQSASLAFYLLLVLPLAVYYSRLQGAVWRLLAAWVIVDGLLLLLGVAGLSDAAFDVGNGRFRTVLTPVGSLASNAAAVSTLFLLWALLRGRVAGLLGIALVVLTLLKDQSRTALLVFLLALAYVFVIVQRSAGGGSAVATALRRIGYVTAMVLVAAGSIRALAFSDRFQLEQFLPQGQGLEGVDVSRALGYQAAVRAVAMRPLVGLGFQSTRDPIWNQVVHNAYLQLAADLGLAAGVALVALVALPLIRIWRRIGLTLRRPAAERDLERLILDSTAFFAVLTLAVKMCFHPLGLVAQDWVYFIAAAPAFVATAQRSRSGVARRRLVAAWR